MSNQQSLLSLVQQLRTVLEHEQRCLQNSDAVVLQGLVETKERLLQSIERAENVAAASTELRALLQECMQLNRQNQTLANQRIKLVNHSVALLKQSFRQAPDDIYTAAGRRAQRPVVRSLFTV